MPKHIRYGSELYFTATPWEGDFSGADPVGLVQICWKTWPKVSAPVNQLDATDSCSPNGAIERIAGMKDGSEFTVSAIWPGPADPAWGYVAGSLSALKGQVVGMQAKHTQFGASVKQRWDALIIDVSDPGGDTGDLYMVELQGQVSGDIVSTAT